MGCRAVRQFFIYKGPVPVVTALFNSPHKLTARPAQRNRVFRIRIRDVEAECPLHKQPEGLVAAHILHLVTGTVDFHDADRDRIKGVL